jgi:hypothetical protein
MTELRTLLDAADPVASEPPPGEADFQRMRSAVIAAAGEPSHRLDAWRPAWIAAAAVVIMTIGAGLNSWTRRAALVEPHGGSPAAVSSARNEVAVRRQLQFVTAGGTRIIWIFNQQFDEGSKR